MKFLFISLLVLIIILDKSENLVTAETDSTSDLEGEKDISLEKNDESDNDDERWVEVISLEPRAYLFHNFLTPQECQHLIHLAAPHMEKSTVVDSNTGKSVPSQVRTSSGMFLSRGQDEIVKRIEERIATVSFIPAENGEGLQILHYDVGQKYDAHYDYFWDNHNQENGGQRIATMLMYLSDVEKGGETVFPSAEADPNDPLLEFKSECAKRGKSIFANRGDAVLFWSMKPEGEVDNKALHGSCPVIEGNKWSATKWMRVKEYKL